MEPKGSEPMTYQVNMHAEVQVSVTFTSSFCRCTQPVGCLEAKQVVAMHAVHQMLVVFEGGEGRPSPLGKPFAHPRGQV